MRRESQTTTDEPSLYSMKLGDAIEVRPYKVTRVPGGWLWHTSPENGTFVPFNNEFEPRGVADDLPF